MNRPPTGHRPGDRIAWRWAVALLTLAGLILASLASGDLPLTPWEVLEAILGRADDFTTTVVLSWRLPRAPSEQPSVLPARSSNPSPATRSAAPM